MQQLKKIASRVLGRTGYQLTRVRPNEKGRSIYLDDEQAAVRAIARVRGVSMVSEVGLLSLWRQAQFCETRSIPGAFVECGVWKGGACALMALANLEYGNARRHIHLFDSFADICQPDPAVDGDRAIQEAEKWGGLRREDLTGALRSMTGFYAHKGGAGRLDDVRDLLERQIGYPSEFLHYHEGWFQDTLPQASEALGAISLLRLDGDYYAATKICLDHLAHRVSRNGFVVFDDYGAYEGCRRAADEYLVAKGHGFLHRVTHDIHYIVV
jgi:hypothetical protein